MVTPYSAATSAYGQAQSLISSAGQSTPNPTEQSASGPSFGDLVTENINSVIETGNVSDQKSLDLVSGDANVVDVVTAIAETELAVETMVTIRDRVIQAYEEIMRMPI